MNSRQLLLIIVVIILIGVGVVAFGKKSSDHQDPGPSPDQGKGSSKKDGYESGPPSIQTPKPSGANVGKRAWIQRARLPKKFDTGTIARGKVIWDIIQVFTAGLKFDSTSSSGSESSRGWWFFPYSKPTELFLGPIRAEAGGFVQIYLSEARRDIIVKRDLILVK